MLAAIDTCPPAGSSEDPVEELEYSKAALNINKKQQSGKQFFKRTAARKGGSKTGQSRLVCWKHIKFGAKAFDCADVANCSYPQGNFAAGRWQRPPSL